MRYVAMLIVLILVAGTASSPAQQRKKLRHPKKHPTSTRKHKGSVNELKTDLARLRERKIRLKAELRQTKRKASVVLSDIHAVDSRLSDIGDKLAETGERLSDSRKEQVETTEELAAATQRLDETRERVRQRLKRMYMQGDSTLLTALVGSESVGDIASRQVLFQRIADKDREMFNDYRRLKLQVAEHKTKIDALVHRVTQLQESQRQQESSLEDARHEKAGYLRELQGRVGELQELVAQFEEDERSITAQIQAYDATSGGRKPLPSFTGRFSRPVNAPLTSGFGMRYHPILHITRLHAGVDFGAHFGATIHAAADGVVVAAQQMRGYGNVVIIDHGGGISTVYAHCSRIMIRSGQSVKRGEPIAAVGATGLATAPHLHFEVRVNGHPVNPIGRL